MKKLAITMVAALAIALPGAVNAATQCKDAKGRFTKCPAAAAASASPHAAATPHATSSPRATGGTQRCRNAKGQFAKCGTPGARPA